METEIYLGLIAGRFAQALLWCPLIGSLALIGSEALREHRTAKNRRRFRFGLKKVGGIWFFKFGRFGCSFWRSKA